MEHPSLVLLTDVEQGQALFSSLKDQLSLGYCLSDHLNYLAEVQKRHISGPF